MKPEERNRRRRHGKAQKARTQNGKMWNTDVKGVRTDLERFRSDLPDVEPVKVTEAAMYYHAEPKGWWYEPTCPMYPEAIGPFSSLQDAISSGERGCTPCNEASCTARIVSTQEDQKGPKENHSADSCVENSADRPGPRSPGRCHVITLKAKPRSWPIIPKRQRDR